MPDADRPGRRYAKTVVGILAELDRSAQVKVVSLPGLPPRGDICDYIGVRECQESLDIGAGIEQLADAADSIPVPIERGLSRNEFPSPIPASTPSRYRAAPGWRRWRGGSMAGSAPTPPCTGGCAREFAARRGFTP